MDYKLFINGEYVDSKSNKTIEVINPANKEVIATIPDANEEDVNLAVDGANEALKDWRSLSFSERADYIEKYVDYLDSKREEIAKDIVLELGAPLDYTRDVQVDSYFPAMRQWLDIARDYKYYEEKDGYRLYKEPVGSVGCITPWNFPFGQIVKKVIPAMLTGNTVVLKPSEETPLTSYYFSDAAIEAKLPAGVFQMVQGGGETGEILAKHPDLNMVSFTGSVEVGREVAKNSLENFKRIALELGGKSASVFLKGADYEKAARETLNAVYKNTGQVCSAKTRILIPREDKDEIEKILVDVTKDFSFGDPNSGVDVGPLSSQAQYDKVNKYIEIGKEEADLLYQGDCPQGEGYYIGPVIFTDVDQDAKIAQEEIFGPVVSVLYYDTIEEAIDIANNSIYGLSGMVHGPEEEAIKVAEKINTGQVRINDNPEPRDAPFGGFDHSGIGREGGIHGFEEFIELKAIFTNLDK